MAHVNPDGRMIVVEEEADPISLFAIVIEQLKTRIGHDPVSWVWTAPNGTVFTCQYRSKYGYPGQECTVTRYDNLDVEVING